MLNEVVEEKAKQSWLSLLGESEKEKSKLWDSTIYRFENAFLRENALEIQASTIPFSIRLGLNQHTKLVHQLGEAYAPRGMFTSCLVKTSDHHLLFIKKSKHYFTPKKYSWVGGVLSNSEQEITNGIDFFNTMRNEIREEVGSSAISSLELRIGYLTENWNVCFLFVAELNINMPQLYRVFRENNDGEAADLVSFSISDIQNQIHIFEPKDQIKFALLGLVS